MLRTKSLCCAPSYIKVSIDLCFFRVLDGYKNSFYPLLVDIFIPLKIAKRNEKICIELWNKIKRWYKGIQVITAIKFYGLTKFERIFIQKQ